MPCDCDEPPAVRVYTICDKSLGRVRSISPHALFPSNFVPPATAVCLLLTSPWHPRWDPSRAPSPRDCKSRCSHPGPHRSRATGSWYSLDLAARGQGQDVTGRSCGPRACHARVVTYFCTGLCAHPILTKSYTAVSRVRNDGRAHEGEGGTRLDPMGEGLCI
jgi:hypothetical protein